MLLFLLLKLYIYIYRSRVTTFQENNLSIYALNTSLESLIYARVVLLINVVLVWKLLGSVSMASVLWYLDYQKHTLSLEELHRTVFSSNYGEFIKLIKWNRKTIMILSRWNLLFLFSMIKKFVIFSIELYILPKS